MIKLTTYLGNRKYSTRLMIMTLVAIFSALLIAFIVRQANFFPSGFNGLSLALDELIGEDWAFPMFMILFNLPLLVFAYFKIGKRFASFTAVYFIANILAYFVFSTYIPEKYSLFSLTTLGETGTKVIAAFVAGSIYGMCLSLTYMIHGCAGGIDVISIHFSNKNKTFAVYNIVISSTMMFSTIFISEFLKRGIEDNDWSFYNIFNNTLYLTMLFIVVSSISGHYSYPRYIKVAIKVITSKGYQLSRSLIQRQYPHKHTVTIVKSPTSNKSKTEIYVVVYYHQYFQLLRRIKSIDGKAFVTVSKLAQVEGYLKPPKLI